MDFGLWVKVLLIFAGIGVAPTVALTFLMAVRQSDPVWRTQVNRVTGVKRTGIAFWAGLFAGLFVGVPLLAIVVMGWVAMVGGISDFHVVHPWVLPGVLFVVVCFAVGLFASRWVPRPKRRHQPEVTAQPVPPPAPAPVAAAPLWSAPPLEGNWARRADSTSE